MQILSLIVVISWIVMGAAAIEVSRALGKQVFIGRLFFPCAIFGGYKKLSDIKPPLNTLLTPKHQQRIKNIQL